MAYWQRENYRESVSMTLTSTYKLDLPEHGLLGSVMLRFSGNEATGYGQAGGDWRLMDKISKIELIGNGSTVIKSLDARAIQALCFFDQGVMPAAVWRNYATNTQFDTFLINFGRWLYDPDMYLDLSKFDNVELRITNTGAAATFSDLTVSVVCFWLREATQSTYLGYLRTEEWQQWTTVTDEWKYLNLPTESLIRRILLEAIPAVDGSYVADTTPENLMYDIKLALDTGNLIIFDGSMKDLMLENHLDHGREMLATGFNYNNADKGYDIGLGYVLGGAVGIASHDGTVGSTFMTAGAVETKPTQHNETYVADKSAGFLYRGISPHNTALIRFDQMGDPGSWLDPERRKTVKLDIHTRNSSSADAGTNKVILDRLVRR